MPQGDVMQINILFIYQFHVTTKKYSEIPSPQQCPTFFIWPILNQHKSRISCTLRIFLMSLSRQFQMGEWKPQTQQNRKITKYSHEGVKKLLKSHLRLCHFHQRRLQWKRQSQIDQRIQGVKKLLKSHLTPPPKLITTYPCF